MRFLAFISREWDAKPVADGRTDQMQAAPALRAKQVVMGYEGSARDANCGQDQVSGIAQTRRCETG